MQLAAVFTAINSITTDSSTTNIITTDSSTATIITTDFSTASIITTTPALLLLFVSPITVHPAY